MGRPKKQPSRFITFKNSLQCLVQELDERSLIVPAVEHRLATLGPCRNDEPVQEGLHGLVQAVGASALAKTKLGA